MVDPRVMDPDQELVSLDAYTPEDIDQIVAVMEAMRRWRVIERSLNDASRKYMNLSENDMRAVRYIIAMQRHGTLATASDIARHLNITAASVSKMVDRLVAGNHIERLPHPQDRRSTALQVTAETQATARQSVGQQHSQRFHVIGSLTPDERSAVIKFFDAFSATGVQRPLG